ncbi:hypothetical protein TTV27_gp1 [Torque teno virus 27]|uniref:Uncharacterized ORF2/4 protein n=3 Tax=Anelloviridae TaxID=687329 RepID=ORF24_TTVV6|nr:hypothetical protein TTV27_gp1 [Torque teno virus 27]Q8V7J2.1 RecName: Full=Uncharacterized ORF2/4 protein [Torque teno virus 27]BAB79307.1 unnamed protein product [Torque teno virus 27]
MPWRPPAHSVPGREGQFYAATFHAHAAFCGCGGFIEHLNSIHPRFLGAGGPPPPPPALRRALPAPEGPGGPPQHAPPNPPPEGDHQPPRRGGGAGGAGDGHAGDGDAAEEYGPEDLDLLFAAAAEDDMSFKAPSSRHQTRGPGRRAKKRLRFSPGSPRQPRLGGESRRSPSPRRTSTPKRKRGATPQAAPAAKTTPASPQTRTPSPVRRRTQTEEGSPHRPPPYIAPPPIVEDLLFPNTQKKKKFSKFDWETEAQLAACFDRPMRFFPSDLPTYPWLPKKPTTQTTFRVSFQLKAPQ